MAKYQITHSCGHEETVQLFGKTKDRKWRIGWLESQPCKECWKKEKATKARQEAQEKGLVGLEGSEKQIQWALSLRSEFLVKLEDRHYKFEILREIERNKDDHKLTKEIAQKAITCPEDYDQIWQDVIDGILAEKKAKFWIENMRKDYYQVYDADYTIEKRVAAAIHLVAQETALVNVEKPVKKTRKEMLADVMRRAWAIAREAAKRLGCKLKDIVFGHCLKQAWAEAKA